MGAGITTPPPPPSADPISELARAMFLLAEEQKETNRLLRKEFEPKSEFMTGHEAAAAFGFPQVKSGHNLKCLKYVVDKYGLKYIKRKPWYFHRSEVEHMAARIKREDLYVTTKY